MQMDSLFDRQEIWNARQGTWEKRPILLKRITQFSNYFLVKITKKTKPMNVLIYAVPFI